MPHSSSAAEIENLSYSHSPSFCKPSVDQLQCPVGSICDRSPPSTPACLPFRLFLLYGRPVLFLASCYSMNVSSQNSYVEILGPLWWGAGAFGKWLGYEGRALMNGVSSLIKEIPEDSLVPSARWGHSKKNAVYKQGRGPPADTKSASIFILDFSASRPV